MSFAQTASSTPTPTPAPIDPAKVFEEQAKPLVESLERCQGEVKVSRTKIGLLTELEKKLTKQVETEKENGRLGSVAYNKAVQELAEVRASLGSAKKELAAYEQQVKELKRKIRKLRGQLLGVGIGSTAVIVLLLLVLL